MAVYKKGKKWGADFRIGGRSGRRIRKSAPTRKLAESIEREFKTRELRDDLGIVELPKITLKDFIEKYLDLHDSGNRETTQELNKYILHLFRNYIHDLPHTFISNIQTTMKYAHLAPGRLKQSVEKLQWYSS